MTDQTNKQEAYDHPAAIARRIKEWLGKYGKQNTSSLLLYEALGALEKAALPTSVPSDDDVYDVAIKAWKAHSKQAYSPDGLHFAAIAVRDYVLAQYGSPAWQPIETAPKDGKSVFVLRKGDVWPGVAFQSMGRWRWSSNGAWAGFPSHWMPLPPAPQEGK